MNILRARGWVNGTAGPVGDFTAAARIGQLAARFFS